MSEKQSIRINQTLSLETHRFCKMEAARLKKTLQEYIEEKLTPKPKKSAAAK